MNRIPFVMGLALLISSCAQETADHYQVSTEQVAAYEDLVLNSTQFADDVSDLQALTIAEDAELRELSEMQPDASTTSNGEPFIFFVIGDTELNMRGNTYPQLDNWIQRINNISAQGLEFTSGDFEEGESRAITKPEIVLLAGDINKDRAFGFSLPGDDNNVANQQTNQLFNQFDEDILFFPGNGNHDWDPYRWGDGNYGHNFGGLLSNIGTAQFVRSRYMRGLNAAESIESFTHNYDRNTTWFPLTSSAEFNYSFEYKGVRFTQLNQFLYQPVAMVSFESIFGAGPAWYFPNRTDRWFQELCDRSAGEEVPHVVVQHFPVNTGNGWWNDDMGSTPDQLRRGFLEIFEDSHLPVMFSGHNHSKRQNTILPYGIVDHTAGYFASGYVIAVKTSASKGAYAVTHIRLDDYALTDPQSIDAVYTVPQ